MLVLLPTAGKAEYTKVFGSRSLLISVEESIASYIRWLAAIESDRATVINSRLFCNNAFMLRHYRIACNGAVGEIVFIQFLRRTYRREMDLNLLH